MENVNWIVRLGLMVLAFEGIAGFTTLNKSVSWQEANESCILATPAIVHGNITVDIDSTRLEEGVKYWVGYTLVNQVFVYRGCTSVTDAQNHSSKYLTILQSAPGQCYSACGTEVFGIKDSRCFCFESIGSVRKTNTTDCNLACSQPHEQITCGGHKSVSLFSVSKVPLENITGDGKRDSCVAFNQSSNSFLLENCEEELRAMCQTRLIRGQAYTSLLASTESSDTEYTWANSSNYCFSKYLYPLMEPVDTTKLDVLVWTGMFLSKFVINKFGEKGKATSYGHIVQRKGTTSLSMSGNTDSKHKALCTDPITTTTTTSITTMVTPTPIATEDYKDPITTTTTMVTSTPINPEDYKGPDNENQIETNETVKLVLYISIPGIVSVILIITIICCKKRAKAKASRQKPTVSADYSQVQDAINNGYAYSVPCDTLADTCREQSNPNDDDAYDVTNAAGATRHMGNNSAESENVYNKLNTIADDAYDHTNLKKPTGSVKFGRRVKTPDDVMYSSATNTTDSYDTGVVKDNTRVVDNVYNVANCEETYSQTTNESRNRSEPTDNIYDQASAQ